MRGLRVLVAASVAAIGGMSAPSSASAQQRDPLAEAESAFQQVDFEATQSAAQRALERGGNGPTQIARIYYLLGVSYAAAGEEQRARDAFVRFIALEPDNRVDRSLSPRLRGPLLEARGYWSSQSARFDLAQQFSRASSAVVVTVRDPIAFAATVRVRERRAGDGEFRARDVAAAPSVSVPIDASTSAVDYVVELLDARRNVLRALGSTDAPLRAEPAAAANGAVTSRGGASPLLAVGATTLAIGGGALVFSGVALALREGAVQSYNDDARCLPASGATREETCASFRQAGEGWEAAAIGAAVAGGVLAVTGGVLIAVGRPSAEAPPRASARWGCAPMFNGRGASCAIQF